MSSSNMSFHKGYFTVPSSWISNFNAHWHPLRVNTEKPEEDASGHRNCCGNKLCLLEDIERGNEKVVVISVFGQSTVDSSGYKTSPLEIMVGKNVLGRNMIHPISVNEDIFTGIEGYYDPDRRIVFLHLTGALDSSTLQRSLSKLNEQLHEKGFLVVWSELRLQYARSLLLLFCVSHILLLCHPSHIFDITYIHLFRTLDSIRSKFQQSSIDILKTVGGVSKDWQANGRMCSPRVLFVFSSRLIPLHVMKEGLNANKSSGSNREKNVSSPLRKLELDLEYQIYRLLRKSRVITNISANSLFALPNNQPFVYITEEYQNSLVATSLISKTLTEMCSVSSGISKLVLSPVVVEARGGTTSDSRSKETTFISPLSDPHEADALSHGLLSTISTERKRNLEHSFHLFLKQHIDEALNRGFDDSVGRHATPNFFEVPKVGVWFEALHKLHEFFVEESLDSEGKEKQVINSLRNNLETDIRFSDARCSKVLPLAISAYNEGLPTHYTRAHHQSKLDMALEILASQARGPMYEKYVRQLEETCEQIWQDGRIGCETLSLTGKTCHHPLHRVNKDPESSLSIMSHSSNVVYVSYCSCGRHQSQMEDPFTVKAANFDFYDKMNESFCSILEYFSFPYFKSSVDDARAAEVNVKSSQDWPEGDSDAGRALKDNPTLDTDTPQTPLELSLESAGLSQGMSANPPRIPEEGGHEDEIIVTVKEEQDGKPEEPGDDDDHGFGLDRQASTTEYLPGMLTTTSPPGLLPQFPSWSLVCLGPSSLYSHNAGICEQPGFLPGTNFLLPWDVTIKIRDKDKWPAIADSMGKKGFLLKNKKNRMGGDLSEFSVKIFLGTEYQCQRGHRFMMAAPDRHLKASSLGHVKDTAVKISNSDMPLYFPCPCSRRGSYVNGQLMRIHVVTPKAPVHVTLNPQVQPSPDPCSKFIPQPPSSPIIKLSASAYWILRLPFVYVGDTGPHYPPNPYQVNVPLYGKLLKGCYGISEITLDR